MMAEDEFQDLRSRIDDIESTLEENVEDVKKRVIQVKRETDTKAPASHTHEELEATLADLEAEIDETRETLDRTNSRLVGGFENFEEILENLLERTAKLEKDVDTVGQVLRSMRTTLDSVAEREQRRARADHLKETAAVRGVRKAKCEGCNKTIDISLLSEATCPSCGESFHTLDANPGFFGTSILETGDRPALEGDTSKSRPDLDGVGDGPGSSDDEAESPFNWQSPGGNGGE